MALAFFDQEMVTTGRQIADARVMRGWTQRQLGHHLGIGSSLVAKWEQGSRIPPYEWLVELDKVLGTTFAEHGDPHERRRGPRPAAARAGATPRPFGGPLLVEVTTEGVTVCQGDQVVDAVVIDLREFERATPTERVQRTSELLQRSLELPAPLAERVVRRLADLR
jgi:transcriptional regulator with XRE-family HTH domain